MINLFNEKTYLHYLDNLFYVKKNNPTHNVAYADI